MVWLSRIYTKTGDGGETALGDGTRLAKHHPRIAAYGTLDELSSLLGVVLAGGCSEELGALLRSIQNDLFDAGSDLCVPGASGEKLRILPSYAERYEREIDRRTQQLEPLRSFVLPGGSPQAAWLHLARTVCRRAERHVSELGELSEEKERVNPEVLRFLNRLSDLLFVLAREANDGGKQDVLWVPGKNRP